MRLRIIQHLMLAVVLVFSLSSCTTTRLFTPASITPSSANESSSLSGTHAVSYADVVSRDAPAVVTVRSERRVRVPEQFPFLGVPLFGPSQTQPEARIEHGLGSGVIVSADGYILTNDHVVDGAEDIRVELTDNRTFPARVVGADGPSDLAVLKIDENHLPVLPLGDSDRVRVGDVVLAIGNPLGVGQTVTMGIISAKGRQTGLSDGSFEDFLQTDAPINQGNSGGALVNTSGELIGINSQIISPSGGNIGIGFAVPANMAKSVMDQLIRSGTVRRGMLGVTVQPVTSDLASNVGLVDVRGALVSSVQPGGPADRAEVRRGDVIVALNGSPISDSNALRNHIANTPPGNEITLTLFRDNREQQVRVKLAELPAIRKIAATDDPGDENDD